MESSDPCRCLAIVWASKEATYKLLAKEGNLCHFVPRQFAVEMAGIATQDSQYKLTVTHMGREAVVKIQTTKRWVHAIATSREGRVVRWRVREIEQRFVGGRQAQVESAGVRLLANDLLAKYGEKGAVLEFFGKIPTVGGKVRGQAGMGISLSHHGAFVSAVIALPLAETSFAEAPGGPLVKDSSREKTCSIFTA